MSDYKKQTDEIHEITLESEITAAEWGSKVATVGSQAYLEVWTHFVGSGSEIEIEVEDNSGKKIETIKGQVFGGYFANSLVVPEKATKELTFTAKLPDHGLEKKSGILKVNPSFKVTNLKWSKKEARRGDLVKLTADTEGLADGTEVMVSIFEHDQDGAHDFITKVPTRVKGRRIEAEWEYEYHEDTDEIPTDEEMKKYGGSYNPPEYFFVVDGHGQRFGERQESGLLRFKDWIEIAITEDSEEVVGETEYELALPDGSVRKGKLDSSGRAREEDVLPGKVTASFPGSASKRE